MHEVEVAFQPFICFEKLVTKVSIAQVSVWRVTSNQKKDAEHKVFIVTSGSF